jgi:hypothetical protein
MGCELIKLIDTSSLTEKQLNSSNRKRANILPIWKYITESYDNKEFMQITTPLEKIEKISYRYSLEDARKPLKRQIMRLLVHGNNPTLLYFYELLLKAKEDYQLREDIKAVHDAYCTEEENTQKIKSEDFSSYSDEGLISFERLLSKEMTSVYLDDPQYEELLHTYNTLHDELVHRGLVEFPF